MYEVPHPDDDIDGYCSLRRLASRPDTAFQRRRHAGGRSARSGRAGIGYLHLIGAVLLMALGQMLNAPTVSTITSRLAAPGRTATYHAAVSTTEDMGTAIGPTTGLALGGLGGSRIIWLLAVPL